MEPALNALWHGKLRPSESFLLRNPENQKLVDAWSKLRKELESRITDEETRRLLHELETAEMNLSEASEIAAFRAGYALGAAMTEDVARERAVMSST
ncbi:MAG: hypothetical protein IJ363_06600 [Clostridia bacterium]|nr:hypothetical protein [Clostridia bacterium]